MVVRSRRWVVPVPTLPRARTSASTAPAVRAPGRRAPAGPWFPGRCALPQTSGTTPAPPRRFRRVAVDSTAPWSSAAGRRVGLPGRGHPPAAARDRAGRIGALRREGPAGPQHPDTVPRPPLTTRRAPLEKDRPPRNRQPRTHRTRQAERHYKPRATPHPTRHSSRRSCRRRRTARRSAVNGSTATGSWLAPTGTVAAGPRSKGAAVE